MTLLLRDGGHADVGAEGGGRAIDDEEIDVRGECAIEVVAGVPGAGSALDIAVADRGVDDGGAVLESEVAQALCGPLREAGVVVDGEDVSAPERLEALR